MDEIIHVQALIQGHVKALIRGIEGAIDLLEAPGSWTQHALARNGQGTPVSGMSPEATQYCIVGALERSGNAVLDKIGPNFVGIWDIYDVVTSNCDAEDLVDWNNDPERTQEDVQRLLRGALEHLRAGDASIPG